MDIVGLCGSLRKRSYNLHALHAAAEVMPPPMKLRVVGFEDVPLFNQDVLDVAVPVSVLHVGAEIAKADGVLIASPEYNFSITGVLKNLVDWLSRHPQLPFKNKPVALLSATGGPLGGSRNQYELRKILGGMEALVLLRPEVFISMNMNRFDETGRLTDEQTRSILQSQMVAFEAWIKRMGSKG